MAYLCPHQCDGKTEYGYCRYTWCVNPLHSNFGTAQQGQGVQKQIITNADRIRSMTDEELAEFIAFHDCCPDGWQIEDARCKQSKGCDECWLEWLRQLKQEADT